MDAALKPEKRKLSFMQELKENIQYRASRLNLVLELKAHMQQQQQLQKEEQEEEGELSSSSSVASPSGSLASSITELPSPISSDGSWSKV